MRIGVILLGTALWGCTAVEVPNEVAGAPLREISAPIGSQADVRADDLSGEWVVRAQVQGVWPFAPSLSFQGDGDDLRLGAGRVTCSRTDLCEETRIVVSYEQRLAGRFTQALPLDPSGLTVPPEIWVHWMDIDRRTMALGDPQGRFFAILDRSATGGSDRINAARDILRWYGYDLTQLVEVNR